MARIFVKPGFIDPNTPEGGHLAIPSPDHGHANLPTDGAWVEQSSYWRRRYEAGDIADDTAAQLERERAEEEAAAEAARKAKPKAVKPEEK